MGRYIDADETLEQIRKKLGVKSLDYLLEAERQIVDVIQSAPTIEPNRGMRQTFVTTEKERASDESRIIIR